MVPPKLPLDSCPPAEVGLQSLGTLNDKVVGGEGSFALFVAYRHLRGADFHPRSVFLYLGLHFGVASDDRNLRGLVHKVALRGIFHTDHAIGNERKALCKILVNNILILTKPIHRNAKKDGE